MHTHAHVLWPHFSLMQGEDLLSSNRLSLSMASPRDNPPATTWKDLVEKDIFSTKSFQVFSSFPERETVQHKCSKGYEMQQQASTRDQRATNAVKCRSKKYNGKMQL